MAKDSKLINVGDSLSVTVNPVANGRVTLASYTDELLGLTANRNVKREFRISTENIFFTDWDILTNENLSKFSDVISYKFYIDVKYTRIGSDTTGEIEFVKIDFQGVFENNDIVAPTIKSSIFSSIIESEELFEIENNLFKKLYRRGIVPNYLTRGDNSSKIEDQHYFSLFSTIAKFFGMLFTFIKRFDNINNDEELLRENVNSNRIFFDESTITLEELKYLSEKYYDEIRKRGTDLVFRYKDDVLVDGSIMPIDGEFVRLFRNKKDDELCREILNYNNLGWCMGQCSPMYKGTAKSIHLNKTPELTEDFQSLDNFAHFNVPDVGGSEYSTVEIVEFEDKNVVELKSLGEPCGLGRIGNVVPEDKLIKVSTDLDYEISFMFRIEGNNESILKFSVEGFDNLKKKLNDSFILPDYSLIKEVFFHETIDNFNVETWVFVRGIIHAYSSEAISNYHTNISIGNNLYFNNRFVNYILPTIQIQNISGAEGIVKIWNYKIKPLIHGKNIVKLKNGSEISQSLGFIQSSKLFYIYIKNNNNSLSKTEIEELAEKYLLPYNIEGVYVQV